MFIEDCPLRIWLYAIIFFGAGIATVGHDLGLEVDCCCTYGTVLGALLIYEVSLVMACESMKNGNPKPDHILSGQSYSPNICATTWLLHHWIKEAGDFKKPATGDVRGFPPIISLGSLLDRRLRRWVMLR